MATIGSLNASTIFEVAKYLPNKDLLSLYLVSPKESNRHSNLLLEELCKRATARDITEWKPNSLIDAAICNNLAAFRILARRSITLNERMHGDLTPLWEKHDPRRRYRVHIRSSTTLLNVLCVLCAYGKIANAREMLSIALSYGATQDVEFQDSRYVLQSCMGLVASAGCLDALRLLLEKDEAYRKKQSHFLRTLASSLAYAIKGRHLHVLQYLAKADERTKRLLRHGSVSGFGCKSYLALAASEADVRGFRFILASQGQDYDVGALEEALCRAAGVGCKSIVGDLLDLNVRITTKTIVSALYGDNPTVVDCLLRRVGPEYFLDTHNLMSILRSVRSRAAAFRIVERCPLVPLLPGALDMVYDVWDEYGDIRDSQMFPGKEEVAAFLIDLGSLNVRRKGVVTNWTLLAMVRLEHTRVLQAVLSMHPYLARETHRNRGNLLNSNLRRPASWNSKDHNRMERMMPSGKIGSAAAVTSWADDLQQDGAFSSEEDLTNRLSRRHTATGALVKREQTPGKTPLEFVKGFGSDDSSKSSRKRKKQPRKTRSLDEMWSSCWGKTKKASWRAFGPLKRMV